MGKGCYSGSSNRAVDPTEAILVEATPSLSSGSRRRREENCVFLSGWSFILSCSFVCI